MVFRKETVGFMQNKCCIFIKTASLLLAVFLLLCGCSKKEEEHPRPSEIHEFVYSDGIHKYGYVDIGSCKKLLGDVYTLVIFMDDTEGCWNETDRNGFYDKKYFPSINYLLDKAEERDVDLTIQNGKYSTKSDRVTPIIYNGKVANSADNASLSLDLLNYAAKTLGFTDAEYMDTILKKNLKTEQIAYVIAMNKPGRAYAVFDNTFDGRDSLEFVVAFSQDESGNDDIGSSILHELLHLFGATDLYDIGEGYKKRYELLSELYPNDIMMRSAVDTGELEIGYLTECLIGWSEFFPAECDCPEWWENENGSSKEVSQ